MADVYVRSTDGNDADDGSTWALAKATLTGANALTPAAGTSIWVSQAHAESTAGALSLTWAFGSTASPIRILCANDGAAPPTALATSATVETTGANGITIGTAGNFYCYGITFNCGTGSSAANLVLTSGANALSTFELCNFVLPTTSSGSRINFATAGRTTKIINCGFKFADAGQALSVVSNAIIRGGSILAGGTSPTIFVVPGLGGSVYVEDFDFSNASASINLVGTGANGFRATFRNCKLPASWSGSLSASTPAAGGIYEMHNCDATGTNYNLWRMTQFGSVRSETTLVKSGGAGDGVTPLSWKAASNANALWTQPLVTGEIVEWNERTGSPITATVDILHDSVTNLKDSEVWIEVDYLSASGAPLASIVLDGSVDVLAAGVDQTASTASWTTSGLSNPNTQKLSVTFTPQLKGFVHARVCVAKASYTVYVDPKVTIA